MPDDDDDDVEPESRVERRQVSQVLHCYTRAVASPDCDYSLLWCCDDAFFRLNLIVMILIVLRNFYSLPGSAGRDCNCIQCN